MYPQQRNMKKGVYIKAERVLGEYVYPLYTLTLCTSNALACFVR
jgi:hypothetical protein